MTITFDPTAFRAAYKAFRNVNCFSDLMLQGYWDTATLFISSDGAGALCGGWTEAQRALALNLLTAHMAAIFDAIAGGTPLSMVTDAMVDKVRVAVKPPPVQEGSQFQYWLGTSPYGIQLLALFNVGTAGGFYIGGLPERDGFRRVGGGFGGIWPRGG